MQGFASIGEVDSKGRARRLPIKADIRRALCFPGGSTLMVSHLNKDNSAYPEVPLKLCSSLKPIENYLPSAIVQNHNPGGKEECHVSPKEVNQMTTRTQSSQHQDLVKDGFQMDGKHNLVIPIINMFHLW
ncbi:hypothetical protein U1Q18_007693 [Sarracenia purpurea var. burkii]